MKFSSVLLCSCICFLHMSFPFIKKTSSRFLFFSSLCSAFPASNSLQIFQLIPFNSLWDLICLSELRWQLFSLRVEFGLTSLFPSAKPKQLGATEAKDSVLPISMLRKHFAICILYIGSSSTRWFLSSTSILYYMLLCNVTHGPNILDSCSRRSLLGNWYQRGRESTSKLIT